MPRLAATSTISQARRGGVDLAGSAGAISPALLLIVVAFAESTAEPTAAGGFRSDRVGDSESIG
jgi:hypothetical protein